MTEGHCNGVPDRSNAYIVDAAFDQAAKDIGSVACNPAAGIVPYIGDHRRFGGIGCMGSQRPVDALIGVEHGHQCLLAHRNQFTPEFFGKCCPLAGLLSVTTRIRVPISGTSAAMKP